MNNKNYNYNLELFLIKKKCRELPFADKILRLQPLSIPGDGGMSSVSYRFEHNF